MFKHHMGRRLLAVALLVGLGFLIPGEKTTASPDKRPVVTHRVAAGQNLWLIAKQHGVTVAQVAQWNKLADPNKLLAGQTLYIYPASFEPESNKEKSREVELLARVIYAEARGENFEGQVAVGAVVLNRLRHPQFPKTLEAVVYQPGAFTAVMDQQIKLKPDKTALKAAEAALQGEDPTDGALFYYNPSTAQDRWIRTRPVLKTIGNHTFSS